MAGPKLINILYMDAVRTEHLYERLEGILLQSGLYRFYRSSVTQKLTQFGPDQIETSGQQIIAIYRYFDVSTTYHHNEHGS